MFKELKSLGVVVKELSNELRQLVREQSRRLVAGFRRLPSCPSVSLAICLFVLTHYQRLYALVQHSHRHILNVKLLNDVKCCTITDRKWTNGAF